MVETDTLSRRLFINKDGDWKKLESLTKEIIETATSIQNQAQGLVRADAKLRALQLEAYQLAPKVDCLFYDSPVSPSRQTLYLKMHLKRIGWDGVRDVFINEMLQVNFVSMIKDSCQWLLKFKNDPEIT